MASPGFHLDPSLANLPPDLLRKKYDELTPEQRQLLGFTRPASQAEFDAAQQNQGGGAPIDFGGRVIPNPNGVQVSSDTDPGIPPLRLPNGVSASIGPYNGTPKLDTSNPAQADVMQPAMQTVQSGWTPVKESAADTSAWTPVQESKTEPAKTAEPPTGTFSERNPALMSGLAKHDPKFAHDIDEVEGMLEGTIKSIYQTTTPGVVASLVKEHPSLAKYIPDAMLRDAAEKKDLPKQAALTLLGTMTGEPSEVEPGAIKPIEAVKPSAASDLASRIGSAAKDRLAKAALKFAARRIPGVHLASDVASFASDVLKPTEQMPVATAPKGPVGPPELWGKTITPEVAPQNAAAARTQTATPAKMEQLLNEATGGRPLQPNVSLKNQAAVRAGAAPSSGLPEGFTPVKSSALKGYKYNPETQELESITSNGGHYIHGDVSPEQFSALESAASKGKAWSDLKSQSTYVGKMVNGKRVNAVPPSALKSATPESTPPGEAPANAAAARAQGKPTAQAAPDEDLTGILQKSVDQAQSQNALAARTSAKAAKLGDPISLDLDPATGRLGARYPIHDAEGNVIGHITATREAGNPDAPLHITGIGSGVSDLSNKLGPSFVKQAMKQIMQDAGTTKIEGMRVGGALGRNIGKTKVSHSL